ncbi:hypothetical protein [Mucilaginibacter sp. FT3.2]|uniref:hypothetical protein n=1 Tax=Mucilaginibacter sp. FT3.2 TaxID=2723090 RepID=UPI0016119F8F|nr:hypothetical protein [Mucilaginibacter sp. FT3.2]MBB6234660.1 hypothetical protein [Mucilaginibacter sp. FT3.2]
MKAITKFTWLIALIICTASQAASAQTKADIFNKKVPITWLGMDFSQMRFIGSEAAYKANGELLNTEFVNKFIPAWANLFITEPKAYNVPRASHRDTVHFAFKVTEAVNSALTKDFFTENANDFSTLKEKDIVDIIKNYDFQGQKGIGMMMIVEGMSKATKTAGAWVTFINMNDKTVLLTVYKIGGSRGFGFRNYWAHSWYNILKDFSDDFDTYKSK